MPEPLDWDGGPGRPTGGAIRVAAGGSGPYFTLRTTLLCLENTHNAAGGAVTPPDEHCQLVAAAKERGLAVHLDGARIWHASVALGVPVAALTVGVDTVQACLSKGLGAPVGSVVAGTAEFVEHARRLRKMLGGGVRQGGVLAAAGLIALDRVEDLAADHENAGRLAGGLAELGWQVTTPATNILLAAVPDLQVTIEQLASVGVLVTSMAGQVRFVTHRDVSAADVTEVLGRVKALSSARPVASGTSGS
jgi:threonine aldolase